MIREARADEAPVLAAAYEWLFAPPGIRPPGWDATRATSRLERLAAADDATMLVADIDGEVVGLCSVYLDISSVRFGQRAWVEDLAVDPDHRSGGHGKALLDAAKDWGARARRDATSSSTPARRAPTRTASTSASSRPTGRSSSAGSCSLSCSARLALSGANRRLASMGCLVALVALISPRLALFLLWIFSDILSRAYDSWIIPLLGFFLLPVDDAQLRGVLGLGSGARGDRHRVVLHRPRLPHRSRARTAADRRAGGD